MNKISKVGHLLSVFHWLPPFSLLNYPTLVSDQFQTFNFRKRTFSPPGRRKCYIRKFAGNSKTLKYDAMFKTDVADT